MVLRLMNHLIIRFLPLLAAFSAVSLLHADDFNRTNVGYTNDGGKIGWYWQASGAGHWSIKDHQLYVNNADPSLQQDDQTLYHTRVSLQPGDWSASVDVRNETTNGYVGMAFMVQPGGTSFYQIRLRSGSRQVQVLKNSPGGAVVIDSNDESSSEIFYTTSFYTISVTSTSAHQFNWNIANSSGSQVAAGQFTDTSYTSGHAGVVKNAGDGNVDIARFDNFYVSEITVPPITQPHPRLLVTAADISEIKADIAARAVPRYSTWLQLRNRANAWSLDPPSVTAPYTGEDAMVFNGAAKGSGHRSSKMALAYLLDGNPAHAAKAKEILLEWARATPRPGTHFPPVNSTNFGAGMLVARGINGFVFTYDYLYNEFTPSERDVIESWFRDMLPIIRRSIETWNTPFIKSATDPRGYVESSNLDDIYFSGQLYQNQSVAHTTGYLLIGYALGDRELVQFALDSKENPRSYLNLFEGNILMAGESPPDVNTVGNPPAQDGEIYDRYRHVQGTGLGYAALSLHQMMAMSEVLYINGIDVYSRTGAHGETLRKPFQFYADFYRLGDSSIKGGFYTGETVTAGSFPAAVFEVANKRYPGTPEITLLLNSIDRVAADPGGFVETYFCYPTLTHGVAHPSWTGALGSNFETAGNWNSAIPVDDAVSQVAFFDGTPQNMPQLTRHRSLAGMHLRGGNTTLSASAGQVLTLGALGIGNGAAGTATHTISAALHLAAPQSWNVPSGKTLTVSGNITGTTGLTKSGVGRLTLSGVNTYTGETNIREGVVTISNAGALGASGPGNGTIVHPGARVELRSASPGYAEAFTIHNTSSLGAMQFVNSNVLVSGNITLADHSRITGRFNRMTGAINLGAYTLTVAKNAGDPETWSAVISGSGGLTMAGGNATTKLTLTGANTYTGDTTVTSGILAVNGSSIANGNKLIINGGKVEATGTEVVGSLVFGTIQQIPGSYGSTASSATYKDDTRFAGNGVIHVAPYSSPTAALKPEASFSELLHSAGTPRSRRQEPVSFYRAAVLKSRSAARSPTCKPAPRCSRLSWV